MDMETRTDEQKGTQENLENEMMIEPEGSIENQEMKKSEENVENQEMDVQEVVVPPSTNCVLRWKNCELNMIHFFKSMRHNSAFDITLRCEGRSIPAHRMVLMLGSGYLASVLKDVPSTTQPIIMVLKTSFHHLQLLLEFMYTGEVMLPQEEIESLMESAKTFRVKGLVEDTDTPTDGASAPI